MKTNLLATTLVAAIALTMPLSAFAKKKAAATPAPDASATPAASATASPTATPGKKVDPERKLPFRGTISSVDKNAKTFSIKGKEKTRVFTVTAQTQLFKTDGATAATWDDLTVGQEVRGSAKKTGEEAFEAIRVKVGAKVEKAANSPSPTPVKK